MWCDRHTGPGVPRSEWGRVILGSVDGSRAFLGVGSAALRFLPRCLAPASCSASNSASESFFG